MFRLSLLILLCQTRVEVTVMEKDAYLSESTVQSVFNDYGRRHGISSTDMHVRLLKNCIDPGNSPARFEAYVTNCNDFQTYLLHFGKWLASYHDWKMIHVKCDSLHFSLCLVNSCSLENYIDLAKCAYN